MFSVIIGADVDRYSFYKFWLKNKKFIEALSYNENDIAKATDILDQVLSNKIDIYDDLPDEIALILRLFNDTFYKMYKNLSVDDLLIRPCCYSITEMQIYKKITIFDDECMDIEGVNKTFQKINETFEEVKTKINNNNLLAYKVYLCKN